MPTDRKVGHWFWLHEFPCWWLASSSQIAALEETAARVLDPIRSRWGKVVPTSWLWWSDGCTPRTGSHGQTGGTVDFVTPEANMRDVYEWGRRELLPSGYVGRWIYEPATTAQNEHIHMATREDMRLAYPGEPDKHRILALVETPGGGYVLSEEVTPIGLPGLTATAGGGRFMWALLLGAAVGLARRAAT